MAQYKVPQDVEADDKLIGPFSFRQFVYLLIAAALIALAVWLFGVVPFLVIIPIVPAILLIILALPLRKDQPMEAYVAAVISYYTKPHKRFWVPGQEENSIFIAAPKKVEDVRVREITGEEATHRLSFLVDIVDTGGYAIKGGDMSRVRPDLVNEANTLNDMFESSRFGSLENKIAINDDRQHNEAIAEMKNAIEKNEEMGYGTRLPVTAKVNEEKNDNIDPNPNLNVSVSSHSSQEGLEEQIGEKKVEDDIMKKEETKPTSSSIIELANNSDYTVATIAKEAKRIKEKEEGEVFISLH